jgi:hypothetical protein
MARRRKSRFTRRARTTRTVSRGFRKSRKVGGTIQRFLKPMAAGIGGGLLGETAINYVAPQFAQIGGYGGAYLAAGFKGVMGKVAFDLLSGKGIGLSGLGIGQSTPVEVSV